MWLSTLHSRYNPKENATPGMPGDGQALSQFRESKQNLRRKNSIALLNKPRVQKEIN